MGADEAAARHLAEQWNLEYREPHTVSVDPRALSLLDAADCRRLRAVPLAAAGGAVVAVAMPDEGRFAGVRALAGEETRFVVISERTLDGLLASRMFAERPPAAQPPLVVAPEAVAAPQPAAVATPPAASPPAASSPIDSAALAEAVVTALERRLPQLTAPAAAEEAPVPSAPVNELVSQLDASMHAWSSLRGLLENAAPELEAARRSLRETKEQLSVAHAEIDQHQRRIRALETELAESRAVLSGARLRLQETAEALDAGAVRLEESHELL